MKFPTISSLREALEDVTVTQAIAGVAVSGVALVIILRRIKSKGNAEKGKCEQSERSRPALLGAEHQTSLFHGIKVIDFATHIAVPTVARVMSDLGAEVIKVEGPSGDIFRNTLLNFEPGRKYGSLFEQTNCGKAGMQINVKTKEGLEQLNRLLEDADVFITNVRTKSLHSLGLDYESLREKYPKLIFAHLTAWGLKGQDRELAGYDIGAFWAASGFALSTNKEGTYSSYPGGFGDLTTGQMILGGISMGLLDRLRSGKGRRIETSLLASSCWCMADAIINSDENAQSLEIGSNSKILDNFYETKDGHMIALSYHGKLSDERVGIKELCRLLKFVGSGGESREAITSAIKNLNMEEMQSLLSKAKYLSCSEYAGIADTLDALDENNNSALGNKTPRALITAPSGWTDVKAIPCVPYEFSCSSSHGPRAKAPALGEHTEDILENGWLTTCGNVNGSARSDVKETCSDGKPLEGITVIEIVDYTEKHDVTVSSATALMADYGARVLAVRFGTEDSLSAMNKKYYIHLNKSKAHIDISEIPKFLKKTNIIVTDLNAEKLERLSLNYDALQNVTLLRVVSDMAHPEISRGLFESLYASTGLGAPQAGHPPILPRRYPENALETIAGAFVFSAACSAAYHQLLTNKSQEVIVSHERIGLWLNQLGLIFVARNRSMHAIVSADKRANNPSFQPSYNSYKTKDNVWIQLLGLDTKRHLGKTLAALGIKWTTYGSVLYTVFAKVVPNSKEKNVAKRLSPVFEIFTNRLTDGIRKSTFAELQQAFKRHDVWYTTVRSPAELASYKQTHDNEIVSIAASGEISVATPLSIRR